MNCFTSRAWHHWASCLLPWHMGACEALREKYASEAYRAEYEEFKKKHGKIDPKNEKQLLTTHLLPDPDAVKIRVYATTSTHKSLSCFRQGSYIMSMTTSAGPCAPSLADTGRLMRQPPARLPGRPEAKRSLRRVSSIFRPVYDRK